MILDFISINTTNILLTTVILNIFYLNNKRLYTILIIDIILNGVPFVTITILLLYYLNRFIFKYLNDSFINKFILSIIYYFLFNIILYSIFNYFNIYIINLSLKYLLLNVIIFYLGLKLNIKKYN